MKKSFRVAAALAGVMGSMTDARSWSLDTHLYVGSKVLQDVLDDGRITLCVQQPRVDGNPESVPDCTRTYQVPSHIVDALKANPTAFLAGTLGPDVYPDLFTGQVTVHPGVKNAWQTDNWLKHLLRSASKPEERAWVSGYLSHASADIFAHTWVNYYAGDIFDLGLHKEAGNEVEERHFTLERYIADRTPTTWKSFGGFGAPNMFVADQLILNRDASVQYIKAVLPAHLVAMQTVHHGVSKIHDEALRISKAITDIAFKELSPLRLARGYLESVGVQLEAAIIASDLAAKALAARDKLIENAEKEILRLAKIIDENPALIMGWKTQIQATKLSLDALESTVEGLHGAVEAAQGPVNELRQRLNALNQFYTDKLCELFSFGGLIPVLKEVCREVQKTDPVWSVTRASLDVAEEGLRLVKGRLQDTLNGIDLAKKSIDELNKFVEKAEEEFKNAAPAQTLAKAQLDLQRELRKLDSNLVAETGVALGKLKAEVQKAKTKIEELEKQFEPIIDLLARMNPLVLFFANWRDDIRNASAAFSGASEKVAQRIVEKSDKSKFEPYSEWFNCWTPVMVAIPSEVPLTVCTARKEFEAFKDKLHTEIYGLVDRLGSLGWLIAPNVKIQQELDKKVMKPLENEVRKSLVHMRGEFVNFIGNRQMANLIGWMDSTVRITDEKLNHIYETDDSKTKLLLIPDVAARVRIDAGLDGESDTISEEKFPALYNAIVLSKLALLDSETLNKVYSDLTGRTTSVYGKGLFQKEGGDAFSILLDAVRSIDGNHQWQAVGLPYPRSSGTDEGWSDERRFGRTQPPGDSGFRFWGDRNARAEVFQKVFKGPLNPGLETHPLIKDSYPFPACASNPFPSTAGQDGRLVPADKLCNFIADSATSGIPGKFSAISAKRVGRTELASLTVWDLRIARNEVFARVGFSFGPQELKDYFTAQAWYKPTDIQLKDANKKVSRLEWRNIATVRKLEKQSQRHVSLP